jgi:hypothetical protein
MLTKIPEFRYYIITKIKQKGEMSMYNSPYREQYETLYAQITGKSNKPLSSSILRLYSTLIAMKEYDMLSKSLGVPMWRSKLNFNNNKARVIIEVSPDIMNTEKVKEYYDLVKEREYLYSRYAIRTTIFFAVCGIMLFLAHIFGWLS